ncbi:acetoacetate--CoA ligase [Parachitinimonas caeni]|uniref:Acetoacetate--CoA ligase n=1 Tax=Parachitinimonas caeni TaxID=3031301 RepID=A0ABT7DZJ2_9NEIS|nr:acetoacetate--CoA ligase [Parachitinimonas caeni]MDK2125244.1 acetoacetate--CoA ligase [Parachitinimonas caeni]
MSDTVWTPSPQAIAQSQISRFIQFVNAEHGLTLRNDRELYDWSVKELATFWHDMWRFAGIRASRQPEVILQDGDNMPGAKWFVGARLNYAENLLSRRDDALALVFQGEDKVNLSLTHAELYDQVARLAATLRRMGVGEGDRVAGFMPNMPQTVIAMLATASLGAIWSSCSPDFGIQGVLDRFGQIAPKVLFTADGYYYSGKQIDSLERVGSILAQLPSVEKVVVVPYTQSEPDLGKLGESSGRGVVWNDFLAAEQGLDIVFTQVAFDHPLFIMYSSGTTGVPKCIVHSVGGTLLQHVKEHILHGDLTRDDRIFYYTTCGWMMWNWLVSALAIGATVLLYDGSPFHPGPRVLWEFAANAKATTFGTSAKYLSALEKTSYRPIDKVDLSALTAVLSTGSPLLPESYDFVYRHIKADIRLSSISGGTDIISCFILGNPCKPVVRGELQQRGYGMAVDIFNDDGKSVRQEKGELVCTRPFPSMPIGFWNDADGSKYHAAYFERFDNIWCHGDYAELTAHDGIVIYGRSDTVLNPGGVRIGTAEIYRQVETFAEIAESMAVGQDWQGDVRVLLFVRMQPGFTLTDELIKRLKDQIKLGATPRHVPAKIIAVADIPRTISGKIVELAVRNVIHGMPVKNKDALANPEALQLFENLAELQS